MKRLLSAKGITALMIIIGGTVWGLSQVDSPPHSPAQPTSNAPETVDEAPRRVVKNDVQPRQSSIPNKRNLSAKFVDIQAAKFLMGAQATDTEAPGYDPEAAPDEGPPRWVSIDAFAIQKIEVTASKYQQCVETGACDPIPPTSPMLTIGTAAKLRLPVNFVTWENAVQYCNHIDARLPTEAEWEFAARGSGGRRFPFGDEPMCPTNTFLQDSRSDQDKSAKRPTDRSKGAIHKNCGLEAPPNPSDSVKAHPLGIVQLAGSMWEWVSDYYADSYEKAGGNNNPTGPKTGSRRVQRGGGWMSSSPLDFRGSMRASLDPKMRMPDVGFRCARSL